MKLRNLIIAIMACATVISCGTAKKAANAPAQKPVETYIQPGADLLGAKDVLRSWAVGISDSEPTARKKALAAASAELGQMLQKAVNTTIENYCVSLNEGEQGKSKEFLSEKTQIVSNQVLTGVIPIFDQWEPKDAEGMYRNYIVLELVGSDFINKLREELNKTDNSVKIDEKLLNELFLKAINSNAKSK
ncbi:MAG: hypothetical protein ACI4TM_04325 [Candidatus Cryptobacteroides sp.]